MLKLSYPSDDQLKGGKYTKLVAEDISAGGLGLNLTGTAYNEKDQLSLLIVLPFKNKEMKYIHTKAKIIRISVMSNRKVASVKFK